MKFMEVSAKTGHNVELVRLITIISYAVQTVKNEKQNEFNWGKPEWAPLSVVVESLYYRTRTTRA